MAELKDVISSTFIMLNAKAGLPTNSDIEKECSKKISELAKMLDKEKIPYKSRALFGEIDQLLFEWCSSDIVCHIGSYGGPEGLFEVMGEELMTFEELENDSVKGCLTIEDSFQRIKKAWEKSQQEADK